MGRHQDLHWQRGDEKEIMVEAKAIFREKYKNDPAGACIALASTRYTLIKRHFWFGFMPSPRALWHLVHAVQLVRRAIRIRKLSPDEITVALPILIKAPKFLGGSLNLAERLLYQTTVTTRPQQAHTQALIEIHKGDLAHARGAKTSGVLRHYLNARGFLPRINNKFQSTRVHRLVGFFLAKHGETRAERADGIALLYEAMRLARDTGALDQELEIKRLLDGLDAGPEDLRQPVIRRDS